MAKYHINPETGRPNICNPVKTGICKYNTDGVNPPHYDNKEEARTAYETIASKEYGTTASLTKNTKTIFNTPDNIHRFVTKMHHPYDASQIKPASLEDSEKFNNVFSSSKPFGGLWFGTQEKSDVEEYGEKAATNWSMLMGDYDSDLIDTETENYYVPAISSDAKILSITDRETYSKLVSDYGFIPNERFPELASRRGTKRKVDWEAFAKDYDGVFISQEVISKNHQYAQSDDIFVKENATLEDWDIETLWICNPEVVDLEKL